jgi:adenosylcobinamide amidohydrolase
MIAWQVLFDSPVARIRRSGRFVVADLLIPHQVVSTSSRNGGQTDTVRHLVNHQSCEGNDHRERHRVMMAHGADVYHARVCEELDLPPDATALMGTAANMNYTSLRTLMDDGLEVVAVVTAGVEGNAKTAGEPAHLRETEAGRERVPAFAGTINTLLLVNRPLTPAALARAIVTMTEGKSAALYRLAVPSRTHVDLATGTGTDQFCIAAPIAGAKALSSASPHVKLGELIGAAPRDATLEAVRWQNGLEPSYTRGVFHALGRYGVKEATFLDDIRPLLEDDAFELLKKNVKSAVYEPLVGAAAHAMAAVSDRARHGTLPDTVVHDALVQQAAWLAANLAATPSRVAEFRERLLVVPPHAGVKALALSAIALGWTEKWRRS